MIVSIKSELWKATHNRLYAAACILGSVIAFINAVENISVVKNITDSIKLFVSKGFLLSTSLEGCSLFVNWLAVNHVSLGSQLLQYLWTIIAAMPFSWSYADDKKSGVYNQIAIRRNIREYYISKYTATFLSGGLVTALPMVVNLMLNALICPYCIPNVNNSLVNIFDGNFLSEVFYTYPWVHSLIWCLVCFILGGVTSCLCFLSGTHFKQQVFAIIFPASIYLVIDICVNYIGRLTFIPYELSPMKLIFAATGRQNSAIVILIILSVLFSISFFVGFWQVKKHELD